MSPEPDIKKLYATTDAWVWTEEFAKVAPDADKGLMVGWFANAIEIGREAGYRQRCAEESEIPFDAEVAG